MRLDGVFVALTTPFDDEGRVAWDIFEAHLEWLSARGVHGFVPCGTTGEAPTLTREERRRMVTITKKVCDAKKLKLVVGCGSNSTSVALEYLHEAREAGADAALVVTPYYNKPTQDGLLAHYRFLADRGGIPIVLYNVPGRTNVNISVETAGKLLEHPQIVGTKEATPNWPQWLGLANVADWGKKSLLAGDDESVAPMMALGGCGVISGTANLLARPLVKLYESARAGDWADAFAQQKKLQAVIQSLFLETNPAPVKFALALRQVVKGYPARVRLPLVSVSSSTESAVAAALGRSDLNLDL